VRGRVKLYRALLEVRAAWRCWRTWTSERCPICGFRVAVLDSVEHVEWHAENTPAAWRRWVESTYR
jgi:hypothetical protein